MTRVAADDKPAPQVSVVIVVYNSGPTLARCLASLKAQTFTDFEVILSDNASPDRSAQAAAAADPSLLLVENGDWFSTAAIDYRGGLRYPKLERTQAEPDRLGAILAPRR